MDKKWIFESELALRAASTSADMIEERFVEDIIFRTKGSPRDLVTELDIAVEKHISGILKDTGYQIIGEETINSEKLNIDPQQPTWFVDPIDGTTNLISSLPFYATSIGLVANFKFIIGVVAMPALKEIFFTMGNQGSFANSKALEVHPAELNNSLIAVSFSSSYQDEIKRKKEYEFLGMLNDKTRGCLRLGSAATNICYVAAGHFQVAYGICNKIWDVAGAIAIALQSGAKVYIDWIAGTTQVSYVVGAAGGADEIARVLNESKLASLKLIT